MPCTCYLPGMPYQESKKLNLSDCKFHGYSQYASVMEKYYEASKRDNVQNDSKVHKKE